MRTRHPRPTGARSTGARSIGAALWLLSVAAGGGSGRAQDADELADELPRIPPTPAAEARATFRIAAGFDLELVASEPDVVDPVDAAFDARGRIFVAEMRDYPFTREPGTLTTSEIAREQPSGRVRLLEDTDGDGAMDRSDVFLDGLTWPTAVACALDGVYVACAPDIVWARDHDGDGVADERVVVFRGFGRRNVQSLVSGLVQGLDGRIYGLSGGNGGDIAPARPADPAVRLGGRDFRFAPGGPLEPLSSSGGQFGLAFDDHQRRFVCSNSQHLRQVVIDDASLDRNPWLRAPRAAATIAVDGGAAPVYRASPAEPWRVVRTRWRAASADRARYPSTELHPTGFFTSATGLVVQRSEVYGPDVRGQVFVGDVGGNLVHRKVLVPDGSALRAHRVEGEERSEFLTSTDNWFRPTRLVEGPDGCVWILDMYRETIEHPYSIPERIKRHLDLTSGNDRGRIWRVVPADGARAKTGRLERRSGAALARALRGPGAWWRETASRRIVERNDLEAVPELVEALSAASAAVRTAALWTLARLGRLDDTALIAALGDPHAGVCESAVRIARASLDRPAVLAGVARAAAHDAASVRLRVALALGDSATPSAAAALAEILARDGDDPWIRQAVVSARPELHGRLLAKLSESGGELHPEAVETIAATCARADPARGPSAVLSALTADGVGAEARGRMLRGLAEALGRSGASLGALLRDPPAGSADAVRAARGALARARATALERAAPTEARIAAARLLTWDPAAADTLEAARELLDPREPAALQSAVLGALGERPEPGAVAIIISRWPGLSPALRREALEALFRRPEGRTALLDAVESGTISSADVDPSRRKQLLDTSAPDVRERAARLLGQEDAADRAAAVLEARAALELVGDVGRGAQAWERACSSCHRAGGRGHAVGPDLESVAERTPEDLLVHIVDPDREVASASIAYAVVTRQGGVLSGIIESETAATITLVRGLRASDTVERTSIARLESTGHSLMPAGLERDLGLEGLADVIAFVRSLGGR